MLMALITMLGYGSNFSSSPPTIYLDGDGKGIRGPGRVLWDLWKRLRKALTGSQHCNCNSMSSVSKRDHHKWRGRAPPHPDDDNCSSSLVLCNKVQTKWQRRSRRRRGYLRILYLLAIIKFCATLYHRSSRHSSSTTSNNKNWKAITTEMNVLRGCCRVTLKRTLQEGTHKYSCKELLLL